MLDIRRMARDYSRQHLDRVVEIDGADVWAKRLDDEAAETIGSVSETELATFARDSLARVYLVHFDAAVLPGLDLVDDGQTLTVDQIQEVGRRRFMLLQCTAQTPAGARELVA